MAAPPPSSRAGFCTFLGRPNVGKSTLLNRLCGLHLSAVSQRPQTTRNRILGIVNHQSEVAGAAQLVILDTPGLDDSRGALQKFMRNEAMTAAGECDVVLHMVDVSDRRAFDQGPKLSRGALGQALRDARVPLVLALNKVDCVRDKERLLPLLASFGDAGRYAEIVPISARTGAGVSRLLDVLASHLPESAAMYPEDMITDRAERFVAQELIREQLFRRLGQEVPYGIGVLVENWLERQGKGDLVIDAVIHVSRDSHKPIVIGRGGSRLKEVGQAARESIGKLLGCPVHLRLHVKVTPRWSESPRGLREMGYE